MSTVNPFTPHVHGMFAKRDTLPEAIQYAIDVVQSLGDASAHATTALMVLINTAADQWPQPGPVEEAMAKMIDARIGAAVDARIDAAIGQWLDANVETLYTHMDSWAEDHYELDNIIDNKIENAMENTDVRDIVRDMIRNDLSISVDI